MENERTKLHSRRKKGALSARICIWSINNHDRLVAGLRKYMWAGSAALLVFTVAGAVELELALLILGFGGLGVVVLLTGLILTRRNILLGIEDPELKAEALQAMVNLIQLRAAAGKKIPSVEKNPGKSSPETRCKDADGCYSFRDPDHGRIR